MNKLIITEAEYECLAKGIAFGVGIGIFVGIIVDNVTLFFALGDVAWILSASILSIIKKLDYNAHKLEIKYKDKIRNGVDKTA